MVSYAEAADILASRDPVLDGLIAAAGPIRISRRTGSHFAGLVEDGATAASNAKSTREARSTRPCAGGDLYAYETGLLAPGAG